MTSRPSSFRLRAALLLCGGLIAAASFYAVGSAARRIEHAVESAIGGTARVEGLRANLLLARAHCALDWRGPAGRLFARRLLIDARWLPLFKRRLILEEVVVEGLRVDLSTVAAPAGSGRWYVGLERLRLEDAAVAGLAITRLDLRAVGGPLDAVGGNAVLEIAAAHRGAHGALHGELNGSSAAWTLSGRLQAQAPARTLHPSASGDVFADAAVSVRRAETWSLDADADLHWRAVAVSSAAWALVSTGAARIEGLHVSSAGWHAARLHTSTSTTALFYDNGPRPAFSLPFEDIAIEARALGAGIPNFEGSARTRRDARLSVSYADGDVGLTIAGLQLPDFSAYVERGWGNRVVSGALNARFTGRLRDGELDGSTRLHLRGLDLTWQRPEAREQAAERLGLHVETLVSLLKDDKGDIRLVVPVKGTLKSPRLGAGGAARKIFLKGLRTAAVATAEALFPPLKAARWAVKGAAYIFRARFEPISFPAGAAAMDAPAQAVLDDIAGALAKKTALRLRVCGRAAADETAPLELAARRGDAVREALIERHDIAADRLLTCAPAVGGSPSVELSLY